MKKGTPAPAALRRQAEERLAVRQKSQEAKAQDAWQATDCNRLIHELQVHQVELELQNEELQQSRGELEAALARYIDLYDFAPVGYIALDRRAIIRQVNLCGASFLGVERSQVLGRPLALLVAEAERPGFNAFLEQVFASQGQVSSWEAGLLREGGEPIWIHVEAIAAEDGQECRLVLVDISERKRAEALLLKSEAFNRLILESVGDGFIVIDRDYRLISASRAFCEQHHTTVAESLGKPCYQCSHHQERPCWEMGEECAPRQTFATGQAHSALHVHRVEEGKSISVQTRSFPLKDAAGAVTAVIEVIEDITEKRTLEEQYRQAQKMESVGRLAGGVAHDFNNMLLVILGYTELAMARVEAASAIRADLEEIRQAAERSAKLTRQLLAFARKQVAIPRVLDLNEAVEGMLKMLRRLIGEEISLNWRPRVNLWAVKIDPSQVDQILANLAVNARDAIQGAGSLSIETDNVTLALDFCQAHPESRPGDYVKFAVSDTGIGMDKALMAHIFEPFFTTKELGKGTGLGLATVYGIVKQNNGFVYVDSDLGHGSTFTIYLPRVRRAASPQSLAAEEEQSPGCETVLVVEDEASIMQLVEKILTGRGYIVLTAQSPRQALELVRQHQGPLHLVITDVVMPEMSGKELMEKIVGLRPGLKVIFMSGYSADVIAQHGIRVQEVDFLQKPFTPKDITTKVRAVLDREAKTGPGLAA